MTARRRRTGGGGAAQAAAKGALAWPSSASTAAENRRRWRRSMIPYRCYSGAAGELHHTAPLLPHAVKIDLRALERAQSHKPANPLAIRASGELRGRGRPSTARSCSSAWPRLTRKPAAKSFARGPRRAYQRSPRDATRPGRHGPHRLRVGPSRGALRCVGSGPIPAVVITPVKETTAGRPRSLPRRPIACHVNSACASRPRAPSCIQRRMPWLAPRVPGDAEAGGRVRIRCPAGSSPGSRRGVIDQQAPRSYSSDADRNSVAESSVRSLMRVPRGCARRCPTWLPIPLPPVIGCTRRYTAWAASEKNTHCARAPRSPLASSRARRLLANARCISPARLVPPVTFAVPP